MAESMQPAPQSQPDGKTLYPSRDLKHHHGKRTFWQKHSLSIVSVTIVIVWIVAYRYSDPSTHIGSFFGNAIADWSGVVVTVLATKWLYEKNSAESRRPPEHDGHPLYCAVRDHSLTIFLVITGIGWVVLFARMDANSKWGQVVGNIVSEWTQIFGLVLLTKKLIEWKSKE
jgi:hypothetical protein